MKPYILSNYCYCNYYYTLLVNYLVIFITNFNFAMGNSYELKELLRQKRYLVYPNPLGSETKVQVIIFIKFNRFI